MNLRFDCPRCSNVTEFPSDIAEDEMVCGFCPPSSPGPDSSEEAMLHQNLKEDDGDEADSSAPQDPTTLGAFERPDDRVSEGGNGSAAVQGGRPGSPFVNSPNRSSSLSPTGIVIHYTSGSYAGSIAWFQNPRSQASAHFVIGKDGRRTQVVPLPNPDSGLPRDGRYKAWHCRSGNTRYIGIEHEGFGKPEDWTDAMLESSAEVAAFLCRTYGIPASGPPGPGGHRVWFSGFGGHDNVPGNDHTDPGEHFPWNRYLALVREHLSGAAVDVDEEEPDMFSFTDPKNGCKTLCDRDGAVYAFSATGGDGGHYLGGLNNHPEWHAGVGETNGPVVAIQPLDDGNPQLSAYVIITRDAQGTFHPYKFPSDGSLARPSSSAEPSVATQ